MEGKYFVTQKVYMIILSIPLLSGCHLLNNTQANNEKIIPAQTTENKEMAAAKSSSAEDENAKRFPPLSEGQNIWQQMTYMDKREMNVFLTKFTFMGFEKFDRNRYFEEEIARFALQSMRGALPERFPYYQYNYIGKPKDETYLIPTSAMKNFVAHTFGIQLRQDTFPFLQKDLDQLKFQ